MLSNDEIGCTVADIPSKGRTGISYLAFKRCPRSALPSERSSRSTWIKANLVPRLVRSLQSEDLTCDGAAPTRALFVRFLHTLFFSRRECFLLLHLVAPMAWALQTTAIAIAPPSPSPSIGERRSVPH